MPGTAIILARGGSKRIPLKNLRELDGKPLIAYPIELCKRCAWIDRIIVTTDHDGIMEAARKCGAEVPFRRPAELSGDAVPSELVTEHALKWLQESGGLPPYAVILTPATPLTTVEQLDDAFRLFEAHPEWSTVTAIRRTLEHPEWMLRVDERGEARTLLGNPLDGRHNLSQNLETVYYPTGAFWIVRPVPFLKRPSMYGDRWGAIEVPPNAGVDIDWPDDLARAARLLRTEAGAQG